MELDPKTCRRAAHPGTADGHHLRLPFRPPYDWDALTGFFAARGELSFETLADTDSFIRGLVRLRGIGDWTAQHVAMRALGDPDAFPAADLVLLRALDGSEPMTPRRLRERAERWRPWRAYAVIHFWQGGTECPVRQVRCHTERGEAPAGQGATTENSEPIRLRSNTAQRDAAPLEWKRTCRTGH